TPAGLVREGHGGADARMTAALFGGADGRSASSRAGADGRSASSRAGADGRSASSRAGADGRSASSRVGARAGGGTGGPDPHARTASARDGALALLIGLAANESLATGRPVDVADLLDPQLVPDPEPAQA